MNYHKSHKSHKYIFIADFSHMNNKRVTLFPSRPTPSGRQMFTKEEDIYLQFLVRRHGEKNWNVVAALMGNRTARQCRDRYRNYLSPCINVSKWTEEEDRVLIAKHREIGPHWKKIATFFNSRTDVNIKNRFNYLMSRQNQKLKKQLPQEGGMPNSQNLNMLSDFDKNSGMLPIGIDYHFHQFPLTHHIQNMNCSFNNIAANVYGHKEIMNFSKNNANCKPHPTVIRNGRSGMKDHENKMTTANQKETDRNESEDLDEDKLNDIFGNDEPFESITGNSIDDIFTSDLVTTIW
ncbi:r2r3-MYB transcription factor [Tritrichomonas foetus]|uniref:R2r3-MYB transcription factor n=1 Tax=Tritrichomonas foetus TaxID=1144522 RepID=A0A1J4KMA6_9EUKA|nr:r2r3-MYB transcription factor [Tritrichomonas foetus]|eukprot:OHT10932.1 r2r3-MYB transcription factor [Tritrichomonas foetus]